MSKDLGGNQPYYNQGMPTGNMNVNLNGNLQQHVDTGFLSKIALILSVLSFICCCIDWLFSIPAIICAIIALIKNKKDACAWAAIVISSISIMLYIVVIMTGFMDGLTSSEEEKPKVAVEDTSTNNDKQQASDDNESLKVSNSHDEIESDNLSYNITDTQFYTFTNSIGNIEYYFIMEVENTGDCNLYLKSCKMDLEDNDGHLLQAGDTASSCPSVIKPGEKGYFYNGSLDSLLDDNIDISNGINCVPSYEIIKANKEPIEYEVSDLSLSKDSGCAKVTGRVTNTTVEDDSYIYLNIVYYDSTGKVIGITGTSVTDIKAGQTVAFDSSSMFMSGDSSYEDIADYKVVAQQVYIQW